MSNSWKPDESPQDIFTDETLLQGSLLMNIAYGAVATLCIQCFLMLAKDLRRTFPSRTGLLLAYVTITFILSTICTAMSMELAQKAFIENKNFPGGANAYEIAEYFIPVVRVANTSLVVSTFFSDALVLWRCTVVYTNTVLPSWVFVLIACAFWTTEFIIGVLFLVQLSLSALVDRVNFTLVFWCFSVAVNVLTTVAIVIRLSIYRHRLSSAFGKEHVSHYTSIISMIIESNLLYTAFIILFIVPLVRNVSLAHAFTQSPALVQAIASLMIVYRVAQGKAWTKETPTEIRPSGHGRSTVRFNDLHASNATSSQVDIDMGVRTRSENGVEAAHDKTHINTETPGSENPG
ncbi:hypothetical protein EIP86_005879 [Pleurotus ostreatoroseus]|nr:hypothetical protein EIP86_005879 [Pleurotus ostreatoroseus]